MCGDLGLLFLFLWVMGVVFSCLGWGLALGFCLWGFFLRGWVLGRCCFWFSALFCFEVPFGSLVSLCCLGFGFVVCSTVFSVGFGCGLLCFCFVFVLG